MDQKEVLGLGGVGQFSGVFGCGGRFRFACSMGKKKKRLVYIVYPMYRRTQESRNDTQQRTRERTARSHDKTNLLNDLVGPRSLSRAPGHRGTEPRLRHTPPPPRRGPRPQRRARPGHVAAKTRTLPTTPKTQPAEGAAMQAADFFQWRGIRKMVLIQLAGGTWLDRRGQASVKALQKRGMYVLRMWQFMTDGR